MAFISCGMSLRSMFDDVSEQNSLQCIDCSPRSNNRRASHWIHPWSWSRRRHAGLLAGSAIAMLSPKWYRQIEAFRRLSSEHGEWTTDNRTSRVLLCYSMSSGVNQHTKMVLDRKLRFQRTNPGRQVLEGSCLVRYCFNGMSARKR
jgi:hypothetical protein